MKFELLKHTLAVFTLIMILFAYFQRFPTRSEINIADGVVIETRLGAPSEFDTDGGFAWITADGVHLVIANQEKFLMSGKLEFNLTSNPCGFPTRMTTVGVNNDAGDILISSMTTNSVEFELNLRPLERRRISFSFEGTKCRLSDADAREVFVRFGEPVFYLVSSLNTKEE